MFSTRFIHLTTSLRGYALGLLLSVVPMLSNAFEVLADDDFPPYSFTNAQGEVVGIDIDIVKELGRRVDIEFDIKLAPFKRILLMIEKGQRFGGFSLFRTAEREAYGLFTHPIHYSTYRIITPSSSDFTYSRLEDLYGKRVGVEAGFAISDEFDQAANENRFQRVSLYSYVDSFNRLSKGGLDAFVGNDAVVRYKLLNESKEKLDLSKIRFSKSPVAASRGAYFVLSKSFPGEDMVLWQQKITEALQQMQKEGFYEKVIQRYLSNP